MIATEGPGLSRYVLALVLVGVVVFCVGGFVVVSAEEDDVSQPLEDGTWNGSLDRVEAVHGEGYHFDGTQREYVEGPSSAIDSVEDGTYTLSLWMKIDDYSSSHYFVGDRYYKYSTPALYVDGDGTPTYRVQWNRNSLDTSVTVEGSSGDIRPGTWYHVVVTADSDDDRTTLTLYLNGERLDQTTTSEDLEYSGGLDFGRGEWNHNNKYLNGSISSVYVYDRPLSTEEVASLYTWDDPQSTWQFLYVHDSAIEYLLIALAISTGYIEYRIRR